MHFARPPRASCRAAWAPRRGSGCSRWSASAPAGPPCSPCSPRAAWPRPHLFTRFWYFLRKLRTTYGESCKIRRFPIPCHRLIILNPKFRNARSCTKSPYLEARQASTIRASARDRLWRQQKGEETNCLKRSLILLQTPTTSKSRNRWIIRRKFKRQVKFQMHFLIVLKRLLLHLSWGSHCAACKWAVTVSCIDFVSLAEALSLRLSVSISTRSLRFTRSTLLAFAPPFEFWQTSWQEKRKHKTWEPNIWPMDLHERLVGRAPRICVVLLRRYWSTNILYYWRTFSRETTMFVQIFWTFGYLLANSERSVLGCIEADCCK